jgi:hypothetical protein
MKPISIFIILVVAIVVVSIIFLNKVRVAAVELNDLKTTRNSLTQKLSVLESVEQKFSGDITFVDVALPSRNAVLYGLSQIRNLAVNSNVIIRGLKAGTVTEFGKGIDKNAISYGVEGDKTSVYNFLSSFSQILPLMTVEKMSLNVQGENVLADITMYVYSTELPKKIPSVTTQASDLTDKEIEVLGKLAKFTLPLFIEPKSQTGLTVPRQDPFTN